MVNVDKINSTIEQLELQSKEIISVVEKQKELERLSKDIGELKRIIDSDTKDIAEITDNIEKLFNMSETITKGIEDLIDDEFSKVQDSLSGYNLNIKNLSKVSEGIQQEINLTNGSIVKNLSEIKVENYKMINEFQGILETKLGLLKSDTSYEIRNCEEKINNKMNSTLSQIVNTIENSNVKLMDTISCLNNLSEMVLQIVRENNKESIIRNNEINSKIDKIDKKNTIFGVVIIILLVINIAVVFMK